MLLVVPPVGTRRHLQAGQETVPDAFGSTYKELSMSLVQLPPAKVTAGLLSKCLLVFAFTFPRCNAIGERGRPARRDPAQ